MLTLVPLSHPQHKQGTVIPLMALAAPWQHGLSTAASHQQRCTPSLVMGSPGRKHPHRRDVPQVPWSGVVMEQQKAGAR